MDNAKIVQAIQYVREHRDWGDIEDLTAREDIEVNEVTLAENYPYISNSIYNSMEEWSKENGLESEWWFDVMDEEEIFLALQ